jgi:hypothetical protein
MYLMRSDKVFEALHAMPNRYMLCQLASKATRRFHRPNTRIQETMNEVLDRISESQPEEVATELPSVPERQRQAA